MTRSAYGELPETQQEGALSAYLSAIRAHPVVFTVITLAAGLASVAFLVTRSDSYEATANILVEPLAQEDQTYINLPLIRDTGDPVRTAQTAASLIKSRAAADLAAEQVSGNLSGREIYEEAVEVNPEGESNILAVTATADAPGLAASVANEFARAALSVRGEQLEEAADSLTAQLQAQLRATPAADEVARAALAGQIEQIRLVATEGDPTLALSQEAVAPTKPTGAPAPLVVVLALLAGMTLGSGTAFLLELMTRRVRDEEEAITLYPLPVLARVPLLPDRARRGPRDSTWYMPPAIREPFLTLTVQLQQTERASTAIMVTSATTGDGKTTSAVNLAASLATTGERVVLLDFDLRKPQVGRALGMTTLVALPDLIGPDVDLARLLRHPSDLRTLRVLGMGFDPEDAVFRESVTATLPSLVEQARSLADYVIVDTPPLGEVSDALRLGRAVDSILVVIRPGNTGRSQLRSMRELLERGGNPVEGLIVIGSSERPGRAYGYGYAQGHGVGAPGLLIRDAASDGSAVQSNERPTESERHPR